MAGMVAQWVGDDDLSAHILKQMRAMSYDTFLHNLAAIKNKAFVSFSSQIGNPCVRDTFVERIAPLTDAAKWLHLYNPEDHVFITDIRLAADNFEKVGTRFDIPNDMINHDPTWTPTPRLRRRATPTISAAAPVAASGARSACARWQRSNTCNVQNAQAPRPYLPIILEACQEEQLSYEYRHGTQSYGAFTYSLAATLRASRGKKANPSFVQLMDGVKERLKKLKYPQVPNLVGPREVLREVVPWG